MKPTKESLAGTYYDASSDSLWVCDGVSEPIAADESHPICKTIRSALRYQSMSRPEIKCLDYRILTGLSRDQALAGIRGGC